ncbi:HAD family hydrolase [Thermocoleostomius sinensis]|jgi:phosphoglycolate phosphatase-like HAD superfamily hydrolase|uniref:HAD family hydrolase n=1 Tax=Thermocoleostomius sinensis A174 TaxID=2016057 RepID=A0A9E8ZAM0_9CYAN|nr:HAD family hydrolase [Thermocoleostomius sinensis]WAL59346.1 HAD family hydrolase [Thermocoleostomius sinensis A174]
MLRIITDFDGPIMDVSERYYQVYQFCLDQVRDPDQPVHRLSKAEFWRLKRAQVPERRIGKISELHDDQAAEFARLRRQTVHTLPYLIYDTLIPGAVAALERLQQLGVELATMTMRRTRELDAALTQYDLGKFFHPDRRYCLSNDYLKTNDIDDKTWLMGKALAEMPPAQETWMIGDTEADILAAKAHAIPVIAVLSGIRNRECLAVHAPDAIVADLNEAVDMVLQKSALVASL